MKKSDLIAAVAEKAGMTKKDADIAVGAVLDAITEALAGGDKVSLVGFGTFSVKERAEREGVNPAMAKDGEVVKVIIPASKVPSFKAGRALKEAVKG